MLNAIKNFFNRNRYEVTVTVKNLHTDEIETFVFYDRTAMSNFCVMAYFDYEILSIKK